MPARCTSYVNGPRLVLPQDPRRAVETAAIQSSGSQELNLLRWQPCLPEDNEVNNRELK